MSSAKPGLINGARPENSAGHLRRNRGTLAGGMERGLREGGKLFHALRIRNKPCSASSSSACSNAPSAARPTNPVAPPTEIAAEEMDRIVTEWFAEVLQTSPLAANILYPRADASRCCSQTCRAMADQFLRPGPCRRNLSKPCAIASSAPDRIFQLSKMAPRPLDLGPITTLTNFGRLPYVRIVLVWLFFACCSSRFSGSTHRIKNG